MLRPWFLLKVNCFMLGGRILITKQQAHQKHIRMFYLYRSREALNPIGHECLDKRHRLFQRQRIPFGPRALGSLGT